MKHPVKGENAPNSCAGNGDNSQRASDPRKLTVLGKEHGILAQH